MMSDYESDAFSGPAHLPDAGPRPRSSTLARRSLRLTSCHVLPSPTSQLQEAGICLCSDLDATQLAQLAALLPPRGSPSPLPPPSPLSVSSRKRLRKSTHPPANRCRGRSTSLSVPAATPGPPSPVAGPSAFLTPQAASSPSSELIPPAFFASINALQGSISSLPQHLPKASPPLLPRQRCLPLLVFRALRLFLSPSLQFLL
ncbi:hypothetical protein AMECASPLE_020572 [Ameca splendens]|uniref:Uncharacterized protein n=1 Tax=Ameca splendens TaxID=208324 RepID=A0ABV0ZYZ8_9TELE